MEIILEHESTKDNRMDFSNISLKRKIMQQCDDGEDSDTSQSLDAEIC